MLNLFKKNDWLLFGAALILSLAGLITMNSFLSVGEAGAGANHFFQRQAIWLAISIAVFLIASMIDWRFLRKKTTIIIIFAVCVFVLLSLFAVGSIFKGAKSWFDLGGFAFQPTDLAKLALVLLLAKYFARRHVEIANIRHILISGFYAFVIFALVLLQPDFGSAIIIFFVWLAMVLVSGISKKHFAAVFLLGITAFAGMWLFAFKDYQKQRIATFLNPLADIRGAGYNAYQSTIAVGSGGLYGKGIGLGSQSKLKFLPEYETDFMFAAFAEEWGLVGVLIIFSLYGTIVWRVIKISERGETNFESLYGLGVVSILLSHFIIHVGMNVGLMPVTGLVMPFMSYGGSHLVAEFLALGILQGQARYARNAPKDALKNEILGVV
jgi:rod shape determining protein RodA